MIDLVRGLVAGATKLSRRARGNGQELPVIEIPPLLCEQAVGRFVEYPSPVGASGPPGATRTIGDGKPSTSSAFS